MRVFISHSSKDKDFAFQLRDLILRNRNDVTVICSDNGFLNGENYGEQIQYSLTDSNIIIVLLSNNYVSSKYCLIELGMIYSFGYLKEIEIFPLCIYPIKPESALAGTPLSHIECSDFYDLSAIRRLFEKIYPHTSVSDNDINQFLYTTLQDIDDQNSIYGRIENVQVFAYGVGLVVKNWNDFVSCQKDDSKKEIVVSYNLNPYKLEDQIKPEFISLVLKYYSSLNLDSFTRIDNNAKIVFKLDTFSNSIHRIFVEIKRSLGRIVNKPFEFELKEGVNECEIPLSEIRSEQLKEIDEICFVLRPDNSIKDEGKFAIRDFEISVES